MKISPRHARRGFAVIIALVAVAVLSILAGALAMFMKVENQLAQNGNDDEKLMWLGRAGVERARWVLAQEPGGPTSLQQIWAGGAGVGAETNSPLLGISLDNFPVGDGTVSLHLIEQESKINVNGADSQLLQQILTTMGADASVISVVADSIQDWVDTDDASRPAGAENDYYQGLVPPYYAKNAPIDDIEELQLIKGVTPHMFKGGPAPDANPAFKHHKLGFGSAPGQEPDYAFGLRDVLTPYSSGKINVNTADANVLTCIPGVDATAAQNIITFRTAEGGENNNSGFINAQNLQAAVGNPQALAQMQNYISYNGSTYEVHATAQVGPNQREFVAVLFRGNNGVQIFSFHPK